MLFSFFVKSLNAWNEAAATVSMGVAFRRSGDNLPTLIRQTLELVGETYSPLSSYGAFLTFIKKPPYNLNCFEHWRFVRNPIGNTTNILHYNEDNLSSVAEATYGNLKGHIPDAWTFNFALKSFLTLTIEIFSPLHNSEYFSDDFPQGDDSGSKFMIRYKGHTYSLQEFWDSGCGLYDFTYPFDNDTIQKIDDASTILYRDFPSKNYHDNDKKYDVLSNESLKDSYEKVYLKGSLLPNQELTDDYVKKCQQYSQEQLARAAYVIADHVGSTKPPNPVVYAPQKKFDGSFSISLTIFLFLIPVTVYSVWRYYDARSKNN